MPKAPCTKCRKGEKAKGKQRCTECLLAARPAHEREQAADWRRLGIPVDLQRSRVPERDWPAGRRWCAGCQSFVRLEDCNKGATQCRTCAGRTAHAGMLKRTYMIGGRPFTARDYDILFHRQGGRCYICQRRPQVKRLAVDHDHVTNEVRGLLCADNEWGCNYAIVGKIADLDMARRLVAYLEQPPAQRWLDNELSSV